MKTIQRLIKSGVLLTPKAYNFLKQSKFKNKFIEKIKRLDKKPELITINYINTFFKKRKAEEFKALKIYSDKKQKAELENFIHYFNHRYNVLRSLLLKRLQTNNTLSIRRASKISKREELTLIAMVTDIRKTRSGHLMLTLEDSTGTIQGIALKNKKVIKKAKDLVLDEVIAVRGTTSGSYTFFIDEIYFPDIPIRKEEELPRTKGEIYALFTSDTHVGSEKFLEQKFKNFLGWLRSGDGVVEKTKYLFIIGDIIDGVGVYPDQEEELVIKDIYKQYDHFTQLIKEVTKDIEIIICPGNHEGLRIAEPQPPIYKDFAKPLHDLPNVHIVSNPSLLQIPAFPEPMKVLLYHGGSFDYYVSKVPSLREGGGYDRPDKIMKFLLKKRHLAPTHDTEKGSPVIAPTDTDHLLIDELPDIFATGHIHKTSVSKYRGIINLCCSSWQGRTPYQARMGHVPEPCRVITVNLKTREPKIMRFD